MKGNELMFMIQTYLMMVCFESESFADCPGVELQ